MNVKSLYDWCMENSKEDVLSSWDEEKNMPITPKDIPYNSKQKFFFKCNKEPHSYPMQLRSRILEGASCVYCNNKLLLTGFNDLETYCNENGLTSVLEEWDYEANAPLLPSQVLYSSHDEVNWKCQNGHTWACEVRNRTIKKNRKGHLSIAQCPICTNHRLQTGFNDLETWCIKNGREDLLLDFDNDKNLFSPKEILYGTQTKVKWKCHICGHEWEVGAYNRTTANASCPACIGHVALFGKNDLYTIAKQKNLDFILDEWDYEKNGSRTPQNVTFRSGYNAHWKCANGHTWQNLVRNRTSQGAHCPYCTNRLAWAGDNDFETWCKTNGRTDILEMWSPQNKLLPSEMVPQSNKKVILTCKKCGHSWTKKLQAIYLHATNDKSDLCPVCSNREVSYGVNDLETWCKNNNRLDILEQWDYKKNGSPRNILYTSHDEYSWKCQKCGHERQSPLFLKILARENYCPACSDNSLIKVGKNDFVTWAKQNNVEYMLKEWDYELNDVLPTQIGHAHSERVHWHCPTCDYRWEASVRARTDHKSKCPSCSGRALNVGFNDLETYCKKHGKQRILDEWDYEKNNCKPSEVLFFSYTEKYYWKCSVCGYCFQATLYSRIGKESSCRACINYDLHQGHNDLETYCKTHNLLYLLEEWDYKKNKILPSEIKYCDKTKKVYWKCPECDKSWKTFVADRTIAKRNCPDCFKKAVSFSEKAFAFYLEKYFQIQENMKFDWSGKKDFDIVIEDKKIIIEYDGSIWHLKVEKDMAKNKLCLANGYEVIRIRENGCPPIDNCITFERKDETLQALNVAIINLLKHFHIDNYDVDCERDYPLIYSKLRRFKYEKTFHYYCITNNAEHVINAFNSEKNHPLTMRKITRYYKNKVYWKCPDCGFEWMSSPNAIHSKIKNNSTICPQCAARQKTKNKNNVVSLQEYCEKNNLQHILHAYSQLNVLRPDSVLMSSQGMFYFTCPICNHREEKTFLKHFIDRKGMCIDCYRKTHPEFSIDNIQIRKNVRRNVFAKQKTVSEYLTDRKRLDILNDWDEEKNGESPDKALCDLKKKYWWKCKHGHSWQTSLPSKIQNGGCLYCTHQLPIIGENDLETYCKNNGMEYILEEWDYSKNNFTPRDVTCFSNRKVHWVCPEGHEYQTTIHHRVKNLSNCPFCLNKRVYSGYNDLSTLYPQIAQNWDTEKNFPLTPEQIMPSSQNPVWWNIDGEEKFNSPRNIVLMFLRKEGKCNNEKLIKTNPCINTPTLNK